ncbi:MAG TPA: hypothetical protein VN019_05500, partial [Oxalicibacterium sp.]|nr:hypothetical protein [Oxalicibacterium sp.]
THTVAPVAAFRFFHANFPILFQRAALRFEALHLQVLHFRIANLLFPPVIPARFFRFAIKRFSPD